MVLIAIIPEECGSIILKLSILAEMNLLAKVLIKVVEMQYHP